jgi:hypothetical protein
MLKNCGQPLPPSSFLCPMCFEQLDDFCVAPLSRLLKGRANYPAYICIDIRALGNKQCCEFQITVVASPRQRPSNVNRRAGVGVSTSGKQKVRYFSLRCSPAKRLDPVRTYCPISIGCLHTFSWLSLWLQQVESRPVRFRRSPSLALISSSRSFLKPPSPPHRPGPRPFDTT